jgi:hypothetical protein
MKSRPTGVATSGAERPRPSQVSSWGGYDIETEARFFEVTLERCARFDDLCSDLGRSPKAIRHSLVCFPPLTPWESVEYFKDMVGRFRALGIDEFVLYWPREWRDEPKEDEVFRRVMTDVIPGLCAL